jgi:TonB family protein
MMNYVSRTTRSLKTSVLATATSLIVALGATHLASAQQAITPDQANALAKNPSVIQNVESFVSAAELLQNEVNFTPASLDINALKRNVNYPEAALKNNVSGRFELIVYIGSNGSVNSVNFVAERSDDSAMNALIASACDAVKKSQFTPAMLNKKAISSAVRIPFNFIF